MSRAGAEPVAIAVLAKAPIPGFANTRLAHVLGTEQAAALQAELTARTVATACAAAVGPAALWAAPDPSHPSFQALSQRHRIALVAQPAGDLGVRMLAAIEGARGPTLVIGTDCPALTAEHLRAAASHLRAGIDAVLIAAEDGGYVLIGMRRPHPSLFADMPWSTETVAAETRRRMAQLGLSWREPAQLWDLDRPEDLLRLTATGLGNPLPSSLHARVAPDHRPGPAR